MQPGHRPGYRTGTAWAYRYHVIPGHRQGAAWALPGCSLGTVAQDFAVVCVGKPGHLKGAILGGANNYNQFFWRHPIDGLSEFE